MDSKKILIVEDSPAMANVVKERLAKEGYDVYSAMNGFEALRDIEDIDPDLIITDINMPKLDGLKLCWAIQNRIETKDIPFIILSSQVDDETLKKGKELGACSFIAKPFDMEQVLDKIKTVLV